MIAGMDYFRKVLGSPQGGLQPSSAETIERLSDRVQSSTLLDDRRDAVRALKSLSKKFRLEVGTLTMDILLKVLETDRSDAEITGYALDTLCNVMSNEPTEDEDDVQNHIPEDLGGQFTEIFIKNQENICLMLSLLEEYDFHVRWPTVKLLTILLTNKIKEIQECILNSPRGLSKLMDLLCDSREIIRNDALLLLIQLTKGNVNIQKIVAFEGAFERSLDIIRDEGNSDGGIVVEDCLLLLLNLMKNNTSNQNFFKEGSFIPRLPSYFDLDSSMQSRAQAGWSAQKVTNIHLMLQLVRALVSPNSPQQQTSSCQKVMNQCGLLKQLCTILMASGVPADVLTETINTVSEVIRGNQLNQEYFASVMAPSSPPRPAIVVLLMSMVNEKQPFVLRCAVLYCFQSFLYKNEVGQSQIVQTLLPTTADVNTITAGQLLCGGLFSVDSLSNWFASVAMLHAILENSTQQEQLLRVQLATSLGNPPVSLLQQCCNMLAQLIAQVSASEGDEQELLVQGLCTFLLGICVLYNDDQFETFNKNSLRQIIANRIGLEMFTDKLNQVFKQESYTKAAKKPNLNYKQANEVIFDFEFTRLFKSLENEVLRAVSESDDSKTEVKKKTAASLHEHEGIVDQYKELIREQDQQLNVLKKEMAELQSKQCQCETENKEMKRQIQQLKDQNAVFKAQKGSQGVGEKDDELSQMKRHVEGMQAEVKGKDAEISKLKTELTVAQAKLLNTGDENKENNPSEFAVLQVSVQQLNEEKEELRGLLSQKEEELHLAKSQLDRTKQQLEEEIKKQTGGSRAELEEDISTLNEKIKTAQNEKSTLQERLIKSNEENLRLLDVIKKLEEEKETIVAEKHQIQEDANTVEKDQDDLLIMLADQDTTIKKYKNKLKELGQEVEEEEDDLDNNEEEDEEEES